MKSDRQLAGLLLLAAVTLALLILSGCAAEKQVAKAGVPESSRMTTQELRGRYLAIITGCNDCHTRGFSQSEATLPESDWLTGDSVGWQGPWGTTYAINLRLLMQGISEEAWVKVSRVLRSRPPMPWWALRELTELDLRAIYRFVRGLGPKGEATPAALPPNQIPKTPYILFVPQLPK